MAIDEYYSQTITRSELLARPGWTLTAIRMVFTDEQQTNYLHWQVESHERNSQPAMRVAQRAEAEGWADEAVETWHDRPPPPVYEEYVPTTQEVRS